MFGGSDRERGPSRGGVVDLDWEEIKNSKHRENYLGQSTFTQPTWFQISEKSSLVKTKMEDKERLSEIEQIKRQEMEMMKTALLDGFVPPPPLPEDGQVALLSKAEQKTLLSREGFEHDEHDVDTQIKGLGFERRQDRIVGGSLRGVEAEKVRDTLEGAAEDDAKRGLEKRARRRRDVSDSHADREEGAAGGHGRGREVVWREKDAESGGVPRRRKHRSRRHRDAERTGGEGAKRRSGSDRGDGGDGGEGRGGRESKRSRHGSRHRHGHGHRHRPGDRSSRSERDRSSGGPHRSSDRVSERDR